MFQEGYKYWLAYQKENTKCCKYKKLKCNGKLVFVNGKVKQRHKHNHPKEANTVLIEKFRKVLTQRAKSERTDLTTIYFEEVSNHPEASIFYSFPKAEATMRKARQKYNKTEKVKHMQSVTDYFKNQDNPMKKVFNQITINNEDGTSITIFFHQKTVEQVAVKIDELHVDTSISFESLNIHLMVIHAIKNQMNIPIIYATMNYQDENTLLIILRHIKNQFLNLAPNNILTNSNMALQNALRECFPDSSIKIFWFHYAQDLINFVRPDLQEIKKNLFFSGFRMLLVLPLLPGNYMNAGIEAIRKWMVEKNNYSNTFKELCDYTEQLINNTGAEKLSIFGLSHCINNHIPNFNKELKASTNDKDMQLWQILEVITKIATRAFIKLNKNLKNPVTKEQTNHAIIINNATAQWIKQAVHLRRPLQFLQLCSHCINDSLINFVASQEEIEMVTPPLLDEFFVEALEEPSTSNKTYTSIPELISLQKTHIPPKPINILSHRTIVTATEPPPLIFFDKPKVVKQIRVTKTEPPPLILLTDLNKRH